MKWTEVYETHIPSGSENALDTFMSLGDPDVLVNWDSAESRREEVPVKEGQGTASWLCGGLKKHCLMGYLTEAVSLPTV